MPTSLAEMVGNVNLLMFRQSNLLGFCLPYLTNFFGSALAKCGIDSKINELWKHQLRN